MGGFPFTDSPEVTDDHPRGGELNAALARGMVQIHASVTGRGPARARVFFSDNTVVGVLESALTRAERSLAEAGMSDAVLDMRAKLRHAMAGRLVTLVEETTGCRVTATMGGNHIGPDLVALVFVLDRPVAG